MQRKLSVPATTFIATANVVHYIGLETEIHDVDSESWIAHTDIPVDLYGVPALGRNNAIEDACEALGSNSVPCADLACFSFFASKIITTGGEGGAVVCKLKADADQIRLLRQQGKDYSMERHAFLGFNYRMIEHQARYGLRELRKLPARIVRTREINKIYREALPSFKFQEDPSGGGNCWTTALVLENRDEVKAQLQKEGIESKKVFCSLADYLWLRGPERPETPVADWLAVHGLCLPSHHSLTDAQVGEVTNVISKFGRTIEYES
jgi:dTDP-4-amino-4,6-dideoxygalactose transaminase